MKKGVLEQEKREFFCGSLYLTLQNGACAKSVEKKGEWQCLPKKRLVNKNICEGSYQGIPEDRGFYCSLRNSDDANRMFCLAVGGSARSIDSAQNQSQCEGKNRNGYSGPRYSWISAAEICSHMGRTTNSIMGLGNLPECPSEICYANIVNETRTFSCGSLSEGMCKTKSGCTLKTVQEEVSSSEKSIQCVKNGKIVADDQCDLSSKNTVKCGESSNVSTTPTTPGTNTPRKKGFSCSIKYEKRNKYACVIQGASARSYVDVSTKSECDSRGGIWDIASNFCPEQGGTVTNSREAYRYCPFELCDVRFAY